MKLKTYENSDIPQYAQQAIGTFCKRVCKLMFTKKDMAINVKEHIINGYLEDFRFALCGVVSPDFPCRPKRLKHANTTCELVLAPLKSGVLTLARRVYLKLPAWADSLLRYAGWQDHLCLYRKDKK
ncbi:MAG: hypothetical protein J6Y02_18075 [Pseudobutyrivibrio sp.]|nr:hypothetical protein [Pseudobutyrivibrio sp.]